MSLGIVMLVHTALDRAEQVARHWAEHGCPVVIHVDARVPSRAHDRLRSALSGHDRIVFSKRHACEWGRWGIVAATLDACATMLDRFDPGHVCLTSGSCLPLRPVDDLRAYLAAHPRTDFIESARISDVPWAVGGLQEERFTLFFPVAWRRHRRLFDRLVTLQRKAGIRRALPADVVPHLGSQWWCLTGRTLRAMLNGPDRRAHDRFFRHVWIPDESYFQSLARLYSTQVESRSLTLSKFDAQGRPHVFYDDHLQLLRGSDCFLARKIWPHADRLYEAFLSSPGTPSYRAEPNPAKIDRVFGRASQLRTHGRQGLFMQSRFPQPRLDRALTAAPYAVFHGFDDTIPGFAPWLGGRCDMTVHGRLFGPDRAEFAGGARVIAGALTDHATIRDADPQAFLTSLIWNARGARQAFCHGAADNPALAPILAGDSNARIAVVTGAWAIPLMTRGAPFDETRAEAARLQKAERVFVDRLQQADARGRVQVWSLAEFVADPSAALRAALAQADLELAPHPDIAPRIADLRGLPRFLQALRNAGTHPYMIGDFPTVAEVPDDDPPRATARRPGRAPGIAGPGRFVRPDGANT